MIMGWYGRKGSSKSTGMTAFADMAHHHKVPILSNYPLTFDCKRMELTDYLKAMEEDPGSITGCMMLWDEAYTDAHSRRGYSQLNIDAGNFGFQNRKFKSDLLYSFIKFTSFENALREASDLTVVCQAIPPFGKPEIFIWRFCLPPEVVLHNIIGLDDYEVIRTIMMRADDLRPVWKLFDTYWKKSLKAGEERRIAYNVKKKEMADALKAKVKGELHTEQVEVKHPQMSEPELRRILESGKDEPLAG